MSELLQTLKTAFGYPEFRPLQREIIEASLANKDVFALLPTGGGKSLCFQLPALLRDGLTIVVSPLIALMKDQVDQLHTAGISATFLNSTLGEKETRKRLSGLHNGEYRLLYAAPERLLMEHWQENLVAWNVNSFAIDEAHCISEWGHDFRPEYRRLIRLRKLLPDIPIMALTATATERVRQDIIHHLQLRSPATFVGSFNRHNLTYRVEPKEKALSQIVTFLKHRKHESGIIYCATRSTAERVAKSLTERHYKALPYHAGLSTKIRSENQELFLRDDAPIICATIAFGMGINKPNVRWIIHHDLPKNIEGYYQETGRAGRDGLPSECLLLLSYGDIAKQKHFIEEISSKQERDIATRQLNQMLSYAESAMCRRRELLHYFGEMFTEKNCGACDNCLNPRESYDATVSVQKLLSCIYRIRQLSHFSVGIHHIINVLTGSANERIRRWGHDRLSTYGIGKDTSVAEWNSIIRELMRLGFVEQTIGQFPTLEITTLGKEALKSRQKIEIAKPVVEPSQPKPTRTRSRLESAIECDEILLEALKRLRKRLADERQVPAYAVFGDVTLRQMAREYPETPEAISHIFGVGERKLAEFGAIFIQEIQTFLKTNPRVHFEE